MPHSAPAPHTCPVRGCLTVSWPQPRQPCDPPAPLQVVENLPEDDPHNPGTIADNVGDNVGDVAGMGSDLFGSFGEASCAALLVGASSPMLVAAGWGALLFPLTISGAGILVCLVTSFVATDLIPVKNERGIENALKMQLLVSAVLMTPTIYLLAHFFLPAATCGSCVGGFVIGDICTSQLKSFFCVGFGLWGGCAIGFITEYYTSFSYSPVQVPPRPAPAPPHGRLSLFLCPPHGESPAVALGMPGSSPGLGTGAPPFLLPSHRAENTGRLSPPVPSSWHRAPQAPFAS